MYACEISDNSEIEFVLDNLCPEAKEELFKIFGKKYKNAVMNILECIAPKYKNIIKLKQNNMPVGIFGLIPENKKAGIFFLTTDTMKKGNILTLLIQAKEYIKVWEKEFNLLMDSCYKKNSKIKKWLALLGFEPSQYQDDDFQVYFKGDLSLYK